MSNMPKRQYEVTITISADSFDDLCDAAEFATTSIKHRTEAERNIGNHFIGADYWHVNIDTEHNYGLNHETWLKSLNEDERS